MPRCRIANILRTRARRTSAARLPLQPAHESGTRARPPFDKERWLAAHDDIAPPLTSELSCYHHLEAIDALDYLCDGNYASCDASDIPRAHSDLQHHRDEAQCALAAMQHAVKGFSVVTSPLSVPLGAHDPSSRFAGDELEAVLLRLKWILGRRGPVRQRFREREAEAAIVVDDPADGREFLVKGRDDSRTARWAARLRVVALSASLAASVRACVARP